MFSSADTIVAIATPPGRGGIGVVRLSGPDARTIAFRVVTLSHPLEPRRATLTFISDGCAGTNQLMDQAVVTFFPAPASYTAEDVVEISAHGSPVVLKGILNAAIAAGARLAEPGEFTLRAYLNGKLDLMQAEAVGDLIDAVTPLQARVAFDQLQGTLTRAIGRIDRELFDLIARLEASIDFPEEGYHFLDLRDLAGAIDRLLAQVDRLLASARRGRLVREGLHVAIVGPPNVGKSSLFNALAGAPRAIVTDIAGTTRDLVTETIDIEGLRVTLVDTAGLRDTADGIEAEGISRSLGAAQVADLVLVLSSVSESADCHVIDDITQIIDSKRLNILTQIDLLGVGGVSDPGSRPQSIAVRPSANNNIWHQELGAGGVSDTPPTPQVRVSAVTGQGLDELRREIARALDAESLVDVPEITNVRHIALVTRAREALQRAREAVSDTTSLPEEFVLVDLQEARVSLEEIRGRRAPDDLLEQIFSKFCVGK